MVFIFISASFKYRYTDFWIMLHLSMMQERTWWWTSVSAPWQAEHTVLDFPAWPVHSSHHAPHGVPPQDGDAQVLAGLSVIDELVVVFSSALEGQSVVQHPQVPQQTWIGNDDDPRSSGFACSGQICVDEAVFHPLFTQQWSESILLQGGVFSLAHGQRHWQRIALK